MHDGVSTNQLMLGKEVEVPLDAITKATPNAPSALSDVVYLIQRGVKAKGHDCAGVDDRDFPSERREPRSRDELLASAPRMLVVNWHYHLFMLHVRQIQE